MREEMVYLLARWKAKFGEDLPGGLRRSKLFKTGSEGGEKKK